MSYDIREAIIQQILTSLRTVPGFVSVYRDRGSVAPEDPDTKAPLLPACVFLDGKEAPIEADRGIQGRSRRGQMAPVSVDYYPQIFIVLMPSLSPENTGIGELLSSFRIAIFKALATNQSLMAILGTDGGITYHGFDSDMQQGSELRGQMRLDFCFTYVFDPSHL